MPEQKTIAQEIDGQIDQDPEFKTFWETSFSDITEMSVEDIKRVAYLSWDSGFDTGYEFSESINKALKEIDFHVGSVNLTSE